MRISDRRGIFRGNAVKKKGGKSREIKAYRLLCPIRSQCRTNYNAPTGALDSKSSDELLRLFGQVNEQGQTVLMVTHSVKAASMTNRVLFIKDGQVFHQIYRGEMSDQQLYQKITDTLTLLANGGERI